MTHEIHGSPDKALVTGGSGHNSKVIVIPFDGELFDKEMGEAYCKAEGGTNCTTTGVGSRPEPAAKRASIGRRDGAYVVDASGAAAGETVEVGVFDPQGRQVAEKRVEACDGSCSVGWSELGALPRGVLHLTRTAIGGRTVDRGNFIRW